MAGDGALTPSQQELVSAARAAAAAAYAPYSGFRVGAAALGASGRVFAGCNVESASYPVTVCAERAAVSAAVTAGERGILAVAVAAGDEAAGTVTPCGMCRQLLAEFGRSGGGSLRDFLCERLGTEIVDRVLSPGNLTSLGYRD